MRAVVCMCLVLLVLLGTSGCLREREVLMEETLEPAFLAGRQRIKEGNPERALQHFLKVIRDRPSAPESHLEAGALYLNEFKDPVFAIYHLSHFIEQKPDAREVPMVQDMILAAKRMFAAQLPGNPFRNALDQAELIDAVNRLERENRQLLAQNRALEERVRVLDVEVTAARQGQLAGAPGSSGAAGGGSRAAPGPAGAASTPTASATMPAAGPRTYTVAAGDTLYGISMRFYSRPDRIQAIFEANRNVLRSVNDLKPGQVLTLPE